MSWKLRNWTAENKRSKWCPKAPGCFITTPTRSGNNSCQGSTGCSLPKPFIAALASPIGFTWWWSSGVLDALSSTLQMGLSRCWDMSVVTTSHFVREHVLSLVQSCKHFCICIAVSTYCRTTHMFIMI